ncbi:MAG: NAD(P)-dependent oxidoreductase [Maritimibacter sp.]|nr:NAD(P)-dependent oxidoreductase [Maritimibacter sp.]MBL6425897.1 NAD(P)-dependent oxidoreductase [Maritimibacter sp.]
MTKPTVGFIGLGAMGDPMARRLAGAGFPIVLLDADMGKTDRIAAATGGTAAAHGRALAEASDLIVTMLPSSAIVRAVLDGDTGVIAGLKPGTVFLEMSSGVPDATRRIAEELASKDVTLMDCPVSGGVSRAVTGELAIMVGGDDVGFAVGEPVLAAMGTTITRTGPVGSGHAMKALNNLVSAGGFLIGIEALLIGSRFGLDPALMTDILNVSTGMNNSTQKKFKQFVLSREFNAGFGLDLMVKDLGIAISVAESTGTTAPFANLCREMWQGAQKTLGPGLDHTDVARFSELLAGSELHSADK